MNMNRINWDEYHDPQAKREQDDKLTFFCFGFATCAIVVVVMLLILTILQS